MSTYANIVFTSSEGESTAIMSLNQPHKKAANLGWYYPKYDHGFTKDL